LVSAFHGLIHRADFVPNLVRIGFEPEMQQLQHADELKLHRTALTVLVAVL
jgi:hypothetical protein